MENKYTKKAADEWTVEEKCAHFDWFHEMAGVLFDCLVDHGDIHPDNNQEILYSLMDLLGDQANVYIADMMALHEEALIQDMKKAMESCDCEK